MRVFLDTNVLVSAFTARGLSADVFRLVVAEHRLLTGQVNLEELRRVLLRRMHAPREFVTAIERLLRDHFIVPKPARPLDVRIRNAADRWVLASAVAGEADVLVTGDKDLLSASEAAPLPVLDPRGFWKLASRTR
ncbi:MAG: putative toxin-antitoxin system toxin component, PIN family [Actinobacteria bacterium]|nr:putative toxin-antitoxin system toxin component, PIN family [Actinomycetota bacterium]